MITKFKKWWRGKCLPAQSFMEAHSLGIEIKNPYTPPLLAKIVNPFLNFWVRNWRFLVTTIIFIIVSIVGITVTLFTHFDSKKQIPPTQDQIERKEPDIDIIENNRQI